MVFDTKLLLSDKQAITATAVSTNVIKANKNQLGKGDRLDVKALVMEAFTHGTDSTLTIQVQTSDAEAFGSGVTVIGTAVIADKASLPLGKDIAISLSGDVKDYIRLNYVVGTGSFTAGKVTAYVGKQ